MWLSGTSSILSSLLFCDPLIEEMGAGTFVFLWLVASVLSVNVSLLFHSKPL